MKVEVNKTALEEGKPVDPVSPTEDDKDDMALMAMAVVLMNIKKRRA